MKISFIILGILGILVAIFLINGCSYPTSYRAFIPKSLDSEYKEFERLCKEEIGKVVYARPVGEGVKLEDLDSRYRKFYKLSNNISVEIGTVNSPQLIYIFISGFKYYTGWTKKSFSMHDDSKKYIIYEPFLFGKNGKKERNMFDKKEREVIAKEESLTIKKMAFNNKEYIGEDDILQEHSRIYYETYMSQIFKEAIYAKSSHYIGNKDIK